MENGNKADDEFNLDRNYWCFISYRHVDNREERRQWASWLHQELETYEVPKDLVGKKNNRGEQIPEYIFPVFRDEDELGVGKLDENIFKALDRSRVLVVLCSPRSLESTYVSEEVRYFKRLGRGALTFAALIEGEPDVVFHETLRYEVDDQGEVLIEKPADLLAADLRLPDGSQGWTTPEPYRQHLAETEKISKPELSKLVDNYASKLEIAKLKLISGILGVPLGTLQQRDKAYQLALAQKRSRNLRRWLVAVGMVTILAVIAGWTAIQKSEEATQERDTAWFNEGLGWLLRAEVAEERNKRYPDTLLYAANAIGYAGQGLDDNVDPYVIRYIRKDRNPQAFQRAQHWIASRPGYRPVWSEDVGGSVTDLSVSPHGRYLCAAGSNGSRLWDFSKVGEYLELEAGIAVSIYPGGERFAIADESGVSIRDKGKEIARFEEPVTALAYNLSGDLLAGARPDGSVILLGETVTDLGNAGGEVTKLVFGAKDATLAAVVPGVGVRLFFHHYGTLLLSWSKHAGEVTAVAYHPNSKAERLVLGMADGSISIWNLGDARRIAEIAPPERHAGPVTCLDYSPDGTRLISGGGDGLVRIWNASSDVPVLLASLTGHDGPVHDVAYLPGGTLVASGGDDGTTKLWEVGEDANVTDLYSLVRDGWYIFEEGSLEAKWNRGKGFLNPSPSTLVVSWQNGDEKSWSERWIEKGQWTSAGLVSTDRFTVSERLATAVTEARDAGEWNLARLRSRQMALLGSEVTTLGNPVKEGKNFTNVEGVEMIWCKPGKFIMGEDEEPGPLHKHNVTLSHGFWLGKHEVTQEWYERIMGENPSTNLSSGPKAPVENINWYEATEFCRKLTDLERSRGSIPSGWEYALPTEAQWEYACRAGTTTKWFFGNDESQMLRYVNFSIAASTYYDRDEYNGQEFTSPVGSFLPNDWGFHDMHGNVLEWCRDSAFEFSNYPEGSVTDPFVIEGDRRVNRGGAYTDSAEDCRSAVRSVSRPAIQGNSLGFRPSLNPSG